MDLGKKLEIWIPGGVFCNFGFGLSEKVGNLDSRGGYSATSDLDLGKKLEIWIRGGYSATSDLDLGKKLEIWIRGGYSATSDLDLGKKLEIWISGGGVFCNFGFELREKVGNLDFRGGGYSATLMEKEKNQNNIKILLSTQSRG